MSDETPTKIDLKAEKPTEEPTLEVVFRNGALENLKDMARVFNIPESELSKVVSKSTRLLNIVRGAKTVSFEDQAGNRFYIDLKQL